VHYLQSVILLVMILIMDYRYENLHKILILNFGAKKGVLNANN